MLDEEHALGRLLADLAPARAAGCEVIVVDGGSTDRTLQVAAAGADRVTSSPRGRATQLRHGAGQARAGVLWFVHADTRLAPAAWQQVCEAARRHPWGRFDVAIRGRSAGLPMVAALMNVRSALTGIATGDQAIFVTRDALQAIGGVPDQPLMEDIEMGARLRRLAWPARLRPAVATSGRRWDRHGLWSTIVLMWSLRLRYFLGASPAALARAYAGNPREADAPRAAGNPREAGDLRERSPAEPGERAGPPGRGRTR